MMTMNEIRVAEGLTPLSHATNGSLQDIKVTKQPRLRWYHRLLYRLPVVRTIGYHRYMDGYDKGIDNGIEAGINTGLASRGKKGKVKQREITRARNHAGALR